MFGCVWAGLGILFVWAYREVLAWYPFLPHRCGLVSGGYFPSFWEGLSLRHSDRHTRRALELNFPSFWEGLSLRLTSQLSLWSPEPDISLPFGRDFH